MVNRGEFESQYAALVSQLQAFDRDSMPDFDTQLQKLQAAWAALQAAVDAADTSVGVATTTGKTFNTLVANLNRSGRNIPKDLGNTVKTYVKVLERLFKQSFDADACEDASCTPVPPPPPAPTPLAPPTYWWQTHYTRAKHSGSAVYAGDRYVYTRKEATLGNYKLVTPVPNNYWPGRGPANADDRICSAGPDAVYTPTIHAGFSSLISDISNSEQTIKQLEATIASLSAKINLCDTTLAEIEHNKDVVIKALASAPDGNFTFKDPQLDWLSYDGKLRVRLAA